jgi:hypothetical protein
LHTTSTVKSPIAGSASVLPKAFRVGGPLREAAAGPRSELSQATISALRRPVTGGCVPLDEQRYRAVFRRAGLAFERKQVAIEFQPDLAVRFPAALAPLTRHHDHRSQALRRRAKRDEQRVNRRGAAA